MLDDESKANLVSGESYILFNNMKGKIVIWINCNKDMTIKLDVIEFRKFAYDLFPNLDINVLLKYLNKGGYVYTDKLSIRELHPQFNFNESPVPTLKDLGIKIR